MKLPKIAKKIAINVFGYGTCLGVFAAIVASPACSPMPQASAWDQCMTGLWEHGVNRTTESAEWCRVHAEELASGPGPKPVGDTFKE